MKNSILLLLLVCITFNQEIMSQDVYELWGDEQKPFYKKNNLVEYEKESWGVICAFDITEPTLTIYRAEGNNTNKAVIIIPGGGYSTVAIYHEGHDVAKVLAANGITAAVLKYRLPNPKSSDNPELVPLADARRALKLFREKRNRYGFERNMVAVLGFSAGSHLSTVASLFQSDDSDENPNFSALIYGVTNLTQGNINWLEESLYYRKMTDEEVSQNRLLDLVSEKTPPTFLVHAQNDEVCSIKESTLYADKLIKYGVPYEMHIFQKGGHGFGLGHKADGTDQWIQLFINWFKHDFN